MIRLIRFPEPDYFDKEIREKGLTFLHQKGILLTEPAPSKTYFKPYWTTCKEDLYSLYQGYCAYTCFHIHKRTGASTVEHIMPKRLFPDQAYEWKNYCLACARINSKKGEQTDLINPFDVVEDLFYLKLETGFMFANDKSSLFDIANKTIKNLGLNNQAWCKERQKCFCRFIDDRKNGLNLEYSKKHLREASIFVYKEAERQQVLK